MATRPTWIGQILGDRYKLEKLLGQGGMSAVYEATDPNLRRTVAVKLIHSHLASDSEFVRRFEEEAAAVAQLRHPNIIQVYDFNHDDEVYYMVLEYLAGETLGDRQDRLAAAGQQLSFETTIGLMTKLTTAVHYAHEQGMVHRDLKPANVMIREDGEPVLMDFGIVKMVQQAEHTASGVIMGTMAYMAPEQIRGEKIDHRIDIYALGVMLFEMLVGYKPFDGESTVTTMMMHLNEPPPDLQDIDTGIPHPLAEVVYKAMEKNREDRYQTAAEMGQALYRAGVASGLISGTEVNLDQTAAYYDATEVFKHFPTEAIARPLTRKHAAPATQSRYAVKDQTEQIVAPEELKEKTGWTRQQLSIVVAASILALFLAVGLRLAVQAAPTSPELTNIVSLVMNTSDWDGDEDGLTNAEEAELGTDPFDEDTDDDGLTDKNEAAVACLNPLSFDTDGDGILDPADPDPCEASPEFFATIVDIGVVEMSVQGGSRGGYDYGVGGYGYEDEPEDATPTPEPAGPESELRYVIAFETDGFDPAPLDLHVHFYYNTVSEEHSGNPGDGPWEIHQTSEPFTRFVVDDRPEGATEICIIVSDASHSFLSGTGGCAPIPDLDQ